jgi:uncharacterized small protein (DUF1192 family)
MKAVEHAVAPDELMAYLDGELTEDRRVVVHAHMLQCDPCRRTVSELRQVSLDAALWRVGPAPSTLTVPAAASGAPASPSKRRFTWYRPALVWQFAGVGLVVALGTAVVVSMRPARSSSSFVVRPSAPPGGRADGAGGRLADRAERVPGGGAGPGLPVSASAASRLVTEAPVPSGPVAQQLAQPGDAEQRGPLIVRNARLRILAKDFDAVRPAIERILRDAGGFVGQIQATDGRDTPRSLRATLRVPAARLEGALSSLRQLGHVSDESQTGDDVTEQVRDLGARLVNARNTERRLNDVLQKRTGDVGDVLEVEREIARVRAEIERLDAERTNVEGRVTHATITLEVDEERKATLELGPLPVPAQFRNAFVDGLRGAFESLLSVSLVALRVGPVLLLWLVVLWWPARAVYRASRKVVT